MGWLDGDSDFTKSFVAAYLESDKGAKEKSERSQIQRTDFLTKAKLQEAETLAKVLESVGAGSDPVIAEQMLRSSTNALSSAAPQAVPGDFIGSLLGALGIGGAQQQEPTLGYGDDLATILRQAQASGEASRKKKSEADLQTKLMETLGVSQIQEGKEGRMASLRGETAEQKVAAEQRKNAADMQKSAFDMNKAVQLAVLKGETADQKSAEKIADIERQLTKDLVLARAKGEFPEQKAEHAKMQKTLELETALALEKGKRAIQKEMGATSGKIGTTEAQQLAAGVSSLNVMRDLRTFVGENKMTTAEIAKEMPSLFGLKAPAFSNDPRVIEFATMVKNVENTLVKAKNTGAITDGDVVRIAAELPRLEDYLRSEVRFMTKLDVAERLLIDTLKVKVGVLGQQATIPKFVLEALDSPAEKAARLAVEKAGLSVRGTQTIGN